MTTPTDRPARPAPKPSQKAAAKKAAPAAKKAAPAKAPAAKKAAPPAKKEGGVVRAASTVSKEGTQKCAFSGEVLPVTAFPTVRAADGSYSRGTVARKNLEAYRAQRKAEREAAKARAAAAKADKAKGGKS